MNFKILNSIKLPYLRKVVQASFFFFCIYIGLRFYQFQQWITDQSADYIPRPPSVEAFLPISALMSLKRLILTGNYDAVHPAGLTIFIAAILLSFLIRKSFCGWICPVGFVSNLVEEAGRIFKSIKSSPPWVTLPLLSIKYLLLSFFLYIIVLRMDITSIEKFLNSSYNFIADAKMLNFFLAPSNLTLAILAFLLVISFFMKNFWCRFICPYGALLGLAALISPCRVKRDEQTCIDCKICEKKCPAAITITNKKAMNSSECIGCLECVAACPAKDCLTVSFFRKEIAPLAVPVIVLTIFLGAWLWAKSSGHWQQQIPPPLLKRYYNSSSNISH